MEDRYRFRCYYPGDKLMLYCPPNPLSSDFFLQRDCYFMQCTGLKDVKGKLVYEKDIIKYIDPNKKETVGYLCVDRFNLLTFIPLKGAGFCEEWADIVKAVFFHGASQIEVLGNIYENKDMMEGK